VGSGKRATVMSKGRRVPLKQVEGAQSVPPTQPLTWDVLQNALKMYAGVPYIATHKLAHIERMPEPSPVERGALARYQERRRKP
jgi:hypothetical protein